jgi:hypothetical protein
LKIDLAVRDWARRDSAVAKRLRRIDNRRMEYMRSLFGAFCPDEDEVEVRCLLALSLFIGSPFIAADHGARSRAEVLKLALTRLEASSPHRDGGADAAGGALPPLNACGRPRGRDGHRTSWS